MPRISVDSSAGPDWLDPFVPVVGQGDAQTIFGRYWPASIDEARFPAEDVQFATEPDVVVTGKWNRAGGEVALVLVHGLTACTEARYMLSLAQSALEQGYDVLRLNVRNCGGTEALCPTLYHSGITADLRSVVDQLAPRPLVVLGFSMGGNQAVKLAGEWGDAPPAHVRGVCGVSVPARLDDCSRRIGEFRNRVYEIRFLRQLAATLRVKQQLMPDLFAGLEPRHPTIWEFDDKVTAPAFGFADAADYYQHASAARVLENIRVPTLMIQAEDDPFIPFSTYQDPAFDSNPNLTLLESRRGGHVAFLGRGQRRFWAEQQALNWFGAL